MSSPSASSAASRRCGRKLHKRGRQNELPHHGYEIVRRVSSSTGGAVTIEDGSLYPALYRLEKKGQIRGKWGVSEAGRRARFYELTDTGRKALIAQTDAWTKFAAGVSKLLHGEGQ